MLERLSTFAKTWLADGKLILLALYLALDHAAISERANSLGLSPQLGGWAVLYALLAAALAAAAYIPQALPRLVVAAILAAGSVALHSYEWTTASPLDYAGFETMLASRGDAGSAMAQHGGVLVKALGAALVLFAALALPPRGRTLPLGLAWVMPCAALLGLSGLLYARGGEGSRALPAAFTPVAYSAIKGALLLTDENAPREQVAVSPSGPAPTRDIPVLVDGAQAVPHMPVDVQALDCDFYAFSGHKMLGPTGTGVLYGKEALLEAMPPYQGGGDMILEVRFTGTTYNELPYKFEAGTPNIAGFIGLGAAAGYLQSIGMDRIAAHEQDLLAYMTERLRAIDGLRLIGTAAEKASVQSFLLDDIHPHDLGTILDHEGVAIRTGHHCAMPVMELFDIPGTARASLALYNNRDDVDRLIEALAKAKTVFS